MEPGTTECLLCGSQGTHALWSKQIGRIETREGTIEVRAHVYHDAKRGIPVCIGCITAAICVMLDKLGQEAKNNG